MLPNRWHSTTVTIWGHKRVTWEFDNDDDLKSNTEAQHEVSQYRAGSSWVATSHPTLHYHSLEASLHERYLPTLIISHESLSITQQSYINQLVIYEDTVIYLNARQL
jgi:hypothetical protein